MQQQVTLQLSTKTITKLMVGMVLAVPAAILLTLAIMVPSIAKADSQQGGTQTANSNPSFNVPAGYVVVPANSNVCANTSGGSASAGATGSAAVVPVAFGSVLPTSYTSTTTQTQTNTHYSYNHSFNTRGDETNISVSDSGNGNFSGNGSGNGNFSGNGSGNNNGDNRDNVTNTTVNTTTTTTQSNIGNTNNSNNSDSVVNSDEAINAVIHDNFSGNTL